MRAPGLPFSAIHGHMGGAKQTVITLLTRMIRKGYVSVEGSFPGKKYFSAISRTEYILFVEQVIPGVKDIVKEGLEK